MDAALNLKFIYGGESLCLCNVMGDRYMLQFQCNYSMVTLNCAGYDFLRESSTSKKKLFAKLSKMCSLMWDWKMGCSAFPPLCVQTYSHLSWLLIICDALQQNREQVVLAYFEIWTIEVGIGVKSYSSVDFEIFVPSLPCNSDWFSNIFPPKNCAFSAACQIQNYRSSNLVKAGFSKSHF